MFRLVAFVLLATVSAPALAQDAADAIVRLNRLENQFRQLSGQVEQLQFENRQLKEQVRKFQEDVEFRFQESRGGTAPRSPAPSATPVPGTNPGGATTTPGRTAPPPALPPGQPQRRSDAFDPGQAPGAPGAPRPLGSTPPSAPLAAATPGSGAPMPLPGAALSGIGDLIEEEDETPGAAPLDLGQTGRTSGPAPAVPATPRAAPSVAAASTNDPRADYEAAFASLLQKQYEQAEMGFRRFLQSYPRDRMVPEAMYWLGESYLQRNRNREAAEQFLNVTTEHPNAAKAPDALLKLGVSLNALGARDRACAVFAELDRKYPQAAAPVKQGSEREQKRAKCV